MGDRPAEAGEAQLEEDKEDFKRRTCLPVFSSGGEFATTVMGFFAYA